ncbi:MAG TPA: sialate O-acetylesterase [Opitutales bacterium]|nr:sialate O-acetylesterase [Opitutales bacterium]
MKNTKSKHPAKAWSLGLGALLLSGLAATTAAAELPVPDGKPADMSEPVKVFIIMGQSNTLEMGKVKGGEGSLEHAVQSENLYPFMIDESGNWTDRKDVRNVSVMQARSNMKLYRNEWLTAAGKGKIGIEQGIGHQLGAALEAPVMVLKSSVGNRSLAWDLLPPGSERYTVDGVTYCGYKDHPTAELLPRPGWKYPGKPVAWYAGKQYDADVGNAKKILENIGEYYPGATEYEVAGFLWWQGDKDRYNEVHAGRYEVNLVQLIKALRKDFNAPDAKFVCATLGQTEKGATGNEGMVLEGQLAVDGEKGKYPEFKGNVATVYSHPLSMGSSSNAHYGGNAKTYMNVGLAMGEAMVELLGE